MQMKGKDSNKHRKIQAILDQFTTTNTTTGNPARTRAAGAATALLSMLQF